jgi:serine/threonine protein kinase
MLAPDTVIQDRYRIVRQLGKGGMGAVYEAVDERLDITVALKETLSADVGVRKQFEQEARLLAKLQHPALPRVSDHFTEGDRAFLVMQFIAGVDLAKIIYQQPGPFPRDRVVAWADQLLDALIYLHAHERQVIHRDIKPHNLKLTATGQIALLDFGLAKSQPAESTSSTSFFGYTKQYAPLEQIQHLATGPQSDIYALGATLYHLLTGVKPADAITRAAKLSNSEPDPLKPANLIHATVGTELAAVLSKAMAQNPEDRYSSAGEFREALRGLGRRAALSQSETQSSAATLFKTLEAAGAPGRGPGLVASVMLLFLTAAIAVVYGYQHWSDWSVPSKTPNPAGDAAPRTTGAIRKGDKAPSSNNTNAISPKSFDNGVRKDRVGVKSVAPASVLLDQGDKDQAKFAVPEIKSSREIKIPNIRLPNAEIRDNNSAPAVQSGLPAYGPQGGSLVQPRLPGSRMQSESHKTWVHPDRNRAVKFSHGSP